MKEVVYVTKFQNDMITLGHSKDMQKEEEDRIIEEN